MRHHNANRKFGRKTDERRALLKSLARSLTLRGSIMTTEAKAKEIRPLIEKLVTKGKTATLADRRALISALGDAATAKKMIETAGKYTDRKGGYTRIIKMAPRKSDSSKMALIEFV